MEGTVKNTLKKGWSRKEERRNKTFTKGGILGPGVGALKRGRVAGTPLRTMVNSKVEM